MVLFSLFDVRAIKNVVKRGRFWRGKTLRVEEHNMDKKRRRWMGVFGDENDLR
jgi:hypothetical protein